MLPTLCDSDGYCECTVSGIISGIGGGSTSFKNGCFHNNMIECDVLLGDGRILTCSENENQDLFRGIPTLLGTLGYITKIKMKIIKTKKFVETTNYKYNNFNSFI